MKFLKTYKFAIEIQGGVCYNKIDKGEKLMKKVLTKKQFICLLLAKLAEKTPIIQAKPKNKDILVCCLPARYKQNIQNIMCEQNGWTEKFSNLIDVEEYFENHFVWETKISNTLEDVLQELNKSYKYNFYYDRIEITFTQEEVDAIYKKFTKPVIENMDHFANLVGDYTYTREFQENFRFQDDRSVKFMHDLSEKWCRNTSEFEQFIKDIKQKAYGGKKELTK